MGFFLASGAPGGLLALRGFSAGQLSTWEWIAGELSEHALTYGYITVSTALMFVGLGMVLGSHEDVLQRVSLTDSLTGLPNRRHFDKKLREELARVDRYRQPLTLILLDLDYLKAINDQQGHEAGDNAVKAVARTLETTRRSTDLAARIGGDEFAVLAPNVGEAEARTLAERIQRTLSTDASWLAGGLPPLRLSIGIADVQAVTELHPERLYSAADRALYRAKEEGRDRIVVAPATMRRLDRASTVDVVR